MSNSFPYRIPFLSSALSLRFRFCFRRWLIIPARSILWHQGLFWKSVLNACVWLMPWVSVKKKKPAYLLQWRWVTRDMDRPPWSWHSLRSHPHFAHFLPSFLLPIGLSRASSAYQSWWGCGMQPYCPCSALSFEEKGHRAPYVGLHCGSWSF